MGIANTDPEVALNAKLSVGLPPRGRAGFFCQSGPLGSAIMREAAARGLGLSTFVSAGNRADVSGNDLLQYWDADPDTDVVLLYLETLGNARKFSRIAKRLARNKPSLRAQRAWVQQLVFQGDSFFRSIPTAPSGKPTRKSACRSALLEKQDISFYRECESMRGSFLVAHTDSRILNPD